MGTCHSNEDDNCVILKYVGNILNYKTLYFTL